VGRSATTSGWLALKAGNGTDDTAMALALGRSAATSIGYDPGRALAAHLEWFRSDPPDVGAPIRAALAAADAGIANTVATEELHRRTGRTG
jgi:ADP-ribosylglycohydrolase